MDKITCGRKLSSEVTVAAPDAPFAVPGTDECGNLIHWPVTLDLLAGGVLLLGDAGTGKSNAMGLLARQIRRALGPDEIMIAFDAGGDLEKWSRPGDHVISRDGWDIPEETGGDRRAARRLARALMKGCLPRGGSESAQLYDDVMNAESGVSDLLADLLPRCVSTPGLCDAIGMSGEISTAAEYMSDWAEAVLVGRFDGPDGISMRRFVREGGGRALFARSGFGEMLENAVCAMLSAAICCAAEEGRRAYVLLDDFDRLSKLTDPAVDALLHAKNIAPIVCAQTTFRPAAMMRTFGTKIVFRTSDRAVREAFADACDVDCAEILDLECGQAAVRCAHFAPFKFRFRKNPGKRS